MEKKDFFRKKIEIEGYKKSTKANPIKQKFNIIGGKHLVNMPKMF